MNLNVLPLGYYDMIVGMDWLEKHKSIINFLENIVTCTNDEGEVWAIRGIPKPISTKQISSLQLKRCAIKDCKLFVVQVEELSQ